MVITYITVYLPLNNSCVVCLPGVSTQWDAIQNEVQYKLKITKNLKMQQVNYRHNFALG